MRRHIVLFVLAVQMAISGHCQEISLQDLINNVFVTNGTYTGGTTATTPDTEERNTGQVGTYESCGLQRECVPRFLCKDGKISTSGEAVFDIRSSAQAECKYLDTCCDIPNKTDTPVIKPVPIVQNDGCGYRNSRGVGFRITGDKDNESEFGEFPWMVAVLYEENGPNGQESIYECGGALIAPTVIITGAHCVKSHKPESLFVRAGEWDTSSTSEVLPYQDRDVSEIIMHEKFNSGALYNDIALLIVKNPFEWEENVRPICLPPHNTVFDHSRCFATGWGKDKFGREGNYQVILKKIDLPVVPHDQCQSNLRNTRLGKYFELNESFLCAGGEKGKDTCKGDGGSPLVCPIAGGNKDRFYHAGIVAWGIGCAQENVPGVYGNVAHLRPWIDEKLQAHNIDFSYFEP